MSIFGKILKTGFDVVTTPIAIAKDVVTMGGALTDQPKPYTAQKLDQLEKDIDAIGDEIDKL